MGTPTSLGPSGPVASAAAQTLRAPVHSAGLNAANVLGLSTQNPRRAEYATPAAGAPQALSDAVVHTGRPAAAALEEPPRVRAMLGALGQELGMPESTLAPLRESLNPLSAYFHW